jgi:hypothetical protein
MSKQFLNVLNGAKNGNFRRWIDQQRSEPRIAWYPSAGEDFRDVMYLSAAYTNPTFLQERVAPPDIFLHTDYFPWENSSFLDSSTIYSDDRTWVTVDSIEELPECELPLDNKIVRFTDGSVVTHRVLFLEITVQSETLGNFKVPIVYAFSENAAFCAERLLPNAARLSHIIHIRYGGGLGGGGSSTGVWLLNVLRPLGCEAFITDGRHHRQSGDERVYERFPVLRGDEDDKRLQPIGAIPGKGWSDYGDIAWNVVM